jgi:hypothetical protein
MIIVKHQTLLETPEGYTKTEREELLRLHTAGLLQVTTACLFSFLFFDDCDPHDCEYNDCRVFSGYIDEDTGQLPVEKLSRISNSDLYLDSGVPQMLQVWLSFQQELLF